MNLYTEYMIARKKSLVDYIIDVLILIAAILATGFLSCFIFVQLYGMIAVLAIFGVWYLAYIVITSRHIEYEYCVANGEMEVDRIIGKKKRKNVATIEIPTAEIIAPAVVDYTKQYDREGINNRIDASKRDNAVLDFFIIYPNDNGGFTRLLFTPNMGVLEMIKKANPRNTFFE
ncbi:MAG: DUF6106 family protein [Bacillota bacterium]|nr:DUF6106 family protein [Bacillota bacterium]